MISALQFEAELRASAEGQRRFELAERREDHDWMEEACLMQKEALRHVGLEASDQNLARLRTAALENPELAVYVRNNICCDGMLVEGDIAPGLELLSSDTQPVEWPPPELLPEGIPLVVMAGSVS